MTYMMRRCFKQLLALAWLLDPKLAMASQAEKQCHWHSHWPEDRSQMNEYYVVPEILYLRAEPGYNSPIRKILARDEKAVKTHLEPVLDNGKEWVHIRTGLATKEETYGWVASNYLSKDPMSAVKLGRRFKNVDFSKQEKVCEHPGNPRRKVRGIYLTMYSAYGKALRRNLELAKSSLINAFVVDVKTERGKLLFKSETAAKRHPVEARKNLYTSLKPLSEKTAKDNIYLIGKLVVFKDDSYARQNPEAAIQVKGGGLFEDRDGLAWVSPYNRHYWDYMIGIAKEMAQQGVQEIQFDYVRFPDTNTPLHFKDRRGEDRIEAIQGFLSYAYSQLKPLGVYVSADVFGLVPNTPGDLYIGQHWEALSNVVDYISPMMYPSHYARGFRGLKNPDQHPGKTLYYSAKDGVRRNQNIPTPAIIRPWIQGFTASWIKGHINYGTKELKEQISALESLGIDEYLIWNPKNLYSQVLGQSQTIVEHNPDTPASEREIID